MMERLRIFISSPGDVVEERVLANNLVRRLADEYASRLWIEPVFWEHEPLLATSSFQTQIPPPRECDVAVCILWSRFGTRLPADITRPDGTRYASGTEYEFEDAAVGFRENGRPQLLVYRKTAAPWGNLNDKPALLRQLEQKEALDAFFEKWFFNGADGTLKAAFHAFDQPCDFESLLEEHLRKLIAQRLPVGEPKATPKPSWTAGSPFRGLGVFEFEHAPIFFGRTRAISDLTNALRANAAAGRAFVLVVGVSGGGKSSLVRAGALPLLVQPGVIEGVSLWRRAVFKPSDSGADVVRALAASLMEPEALPELGADGTSVEQLADLLRQSPAGAFPLIKGGLSQAAAELMRDQSLSQQPEARLVVLVDQLEELFTLPDVSRADQEALVAAISALARCGKVWVIATLRGDVYQRTFEFPELLALQEGSGLYALPLATPAEIGQMIRQPAHVAGLQFEVNQETNTSLDEVLRDAAAASPESLPLMEFALDELYERRSGNVLTYAAYEELGRIEGAISHRAEAVLDGLPSPVQAMLPRLFRALVHVVENDSGKEETAIRHPALLAPLNADVSLAQLVKALVNGRLLTADRLRDGSPVVRLAHEALLRHWPKLRNWLTENREWLRVRARVEKAASHWMREGRSTDVLLNRGKPLDEATNLLATAEVDLSDDARSFVAASIEKDRWRRSRERLFLAALVLLTIVSGVSAFAAWRSRGVAIAERINADSERDKATAEAARADKEAQRATDNANEALMRKIEAEFQLRKIEDSAYNASIGQARAELEAGAANRARYILDQCRRWDLCSWEFDYLVGIVDGRKGVRRTNSPYGDAPTTFAVHPDGAIIAACLKKTEIRADTQKIETIPCIRLLDIKTLEPIRDIEVETKLSCVAFSADGQHVFGGNENGELTSYETETGKPHRQWDTGRFVQGKLFAVASDREGKLVAVGVASELVSMVRLIHADTGEVTRTVPIPFLIDPEHLAISADGGRICTLTGTRHARVYDTEDGKQLAALDLPSGNFTSLTFRPDGQYVAAGSSDGLLYLWEVSTGQLAGLQNVGTSPATAAIYSPDGTRIATGHQDGTVRLWNSLLTSKPTTLLGSSGEVRRVAFTPDGRELVTLDSQMITNFPGIRVWSIDSLAARKSPLVTGKIFHPQFLPDGRFQAVGSQGVSIWNLETRAMDEVLDISPWDGGWAAASPDGRTVLIPSENNVRVVFAGADREDVVLSCPAKPVDFTFDSRAENLFVRHTDNSAWCWNLTAEKPVVRYKLAGVEGVSVLVDNDSIVLGLPGEAGFAEYNFKTGEQIGVISTTGHLSSVATSHDGKRLATVNGSSIDVWERDHEQGNWKVVSSTWVTFLPMAIAFTADGRRLFLGGLDLVDYAGGRGEVYGWMIGSFTPPQLFSRYPSNVRDISFSRCGTYMAVTHGGANYHTVEILDDGGRFRERHAMVYGNGVRDVAFDFSDNRLLALGGKDVLALNAVTGQEVDPLGSGDVFARETTFHSLTTSPDGHWAVTTDAAGHQLVVWDIESNTAKFGLSGLPAKPEAVCFAPDAVRIAAVLANKTVQIWNLKTRELEKTLGGAQGALTSVAWNIDGRTIAAAAGEVVHLFDAVQGTPLNVTLPHPSPVQSLAFSTDGKLLFTAAGDETIRGWDFLRGEVTRELVGQGLKVYELAPRPQGRLLASRDLRGRIDVWDLDQPTATMTTINSNDNRHGRYLTHIAWAHDGRRLAACGSSGYLVWTLDSILQKR